MWGQHQINGNHRSGEDNGLSMTKMCLTETNQNKEEKNVKLYGYRTERTGGGHWNGLYKETVFANSHSNLVVNTKRYSNSDSQTTRTRVSIAPH